MPIAFPIFSLRFKFVLKQFQVCFNPFFRKIKRILDSIWLFLANLAINKDIESKRKFCRVSIFRDFLMFYQISFSPQVKWSGVITYEHGISELFHELSNVNHFQIFLETFWCFTKFFFHHKWNDVRLSLINMIYTSSLTSCETA